MRRRFTLAIVGVVAGTLLVAGLGTLALLTVEARRSARNDAVDLARRIAADYRSPAEPVPSLRNLQDLLRSTQQLTLIGVRPARVPSLPAGLTADDLDLATLAAGGTVSGFKGRTAFAAVPFDQRRVTLAVVVTQRAAATAGAGVYFLVAGLCLVAVALAVAESLAARITNRVVRVQEAAGRIAQGDLAARVPDDARSYPELRELSASINAMADNLERLRGQERQFLLSVSHDLRTPLTSIRGFAEALADGTTTDTAKAAGVIAAESRRLERLVRDLLDLAKLDARSFSLLLRPTDLAAVVGETALGFRPTAAALGIEVVVHDPVVDGGGPLPPVAADPDRLSQVVANLVENACKYATRTIEVGTWWRQGEALVTIDDDGPGIDAQDLPHVFDRLWTNNRGGQGRQVGSGLGLAIAWELATAMGGRIRAESPVPRWEATDTPGTRLVVSLRPAS
jgi:signal transduction histidine kinase